MSVEMFDLNNQVALVTGGGGVLGGAMARGLAAAGAKVVVLGRKIAPLENQVSLIEAQGGQALCITCDVLDRESLEAAKHDILREWGRIDILVNAAGGNMSGATIMPDQDIFDLSVEDFRKVSQLNLDGSLIPALVFGAAMKEAGQGSIVNISSMTAQMPFTRVVGYSAAKAGVDNLTKWLAVEMAQKFGNGIRVNAIAPGVFIGEQNRSLLLNEDESLTSRGQTIVDRTPMKRFGEPDELVSTLLYLCSQGSSFITGIVIPVDGGFSAYSGV